MNELENCLGISLGTYRLGLAVRIKNELIYWHVRGFDETYSTKKAKRIWRAIEQTILRFDIKVIGIKLPPKHSMKDGISHCIKYITEKALEKEVALYFYDIGAINKHFCNKDILDKTELSLSISEKYPQLKREFFKLEKCQYHMKVFEAVGAMELASLEAL